MRFSYIVVLISIILVINSFGQIKKGLFNIDYDNNGIDSKIYCFVPEDYDSTKSYPFVWGWHGAGMPGFVLRDALAVVFGQNFDAIISCPDANNLNGKPVEHLTNLANESYNLINQNYNIDNNKIVITGFSWGGRVAYQLGLTNPGLVNGIIGIAPTIGSHHFDKTMWSNINSVRMATLIGDQDFYFDNVDPLMKEIQSREADLLYKVKNRIGHVDSVYANSQEFIEDYIESI